MNHNVFSPAPLDRVLRGSPLIEDRLLAKTQLNIGLAKLSTEPIGRSCADLFMRVSRGSVHAEDRVGASSVLNNILNPLLEPEGL